MAKIIKAKISITHGEDGTVYFDVCGHQYRTDKHGDGLWAWCKTSSYDLQEQEYIWGWKQKLGTCQFSLPSSRAGQRKAIEKFFADKIEEWEEESRFEKYCNEHPEFVAQAEKEAYEDFEELFEEEAAAYGYDEE